ncbi:hypothetical protein DCE79_08545 [Lysinibacillus sp. 2017]|uniref:S-layer homology domain-containing protein n=1 Tax=unclassified Lysinibacillus TaxID=2636778 RepID=UPI000D528453|nr:MULTISPECIES: S-layer homology domain-containing protein [unclassified Lysinibacillus]AWE07416.1 hypothetical protein DCE79_08545 [Lysinibacillus sp. 2017]TGN36580.1 S-layer homology domain-containing protein [Lysinibacillus sp. S2017]
MNYKKSTTMLALAAIPAAVLFVPPTETHAAENSGAVGYYNGNTYYSSEVTYVETLINQINPYSTSFNYQVQLAKNAYENLTTIQKSQVSNTYTLFNYLNTYTDYQTINTNFSNKMNAISINDRSFIRNVEEANRYYNSLSSLQKSVIPTYLVTQLQTYLTNIANMRAAEAKLEALNVKDTDYQVQYSAAMLAYNALPYNYRTLISSKAAEKVKEYELYFSLEYNRSAAQKVINVISKLSTISSPKEVQDARELYNNLTVYQQNFVTNTRDLTYFETVLKNPHLGWDPEYDYYNGEDEDEEFDDITIKKSGNSYAVLVPLSEMKRYTPTTITVSKNITLKVSRTSIPDYRDTSVIAMSIDEYDGNSIVFTATVNNEDVQFSNYVDIELKGLPSNATILRVDENGNEVAANYKKSGTKYTIKTKKSAEFVVSTKSVVFHDIRTDGNRVAIEQLAKRNIVSGTSSNYFEPNAQVTVGQYATMIARAMNLSATESSPYVDVKGKWYGASIQALIEANILDDKNGKYYYPDQIVTRQQAAVIAVRMLKQAGIALPDTNYSKVPFKDFQKVSANARYHVAVAYQLGIFGGKSNGNFDPNDKLTRSQMAKVLYTTLQMANML